eukprot:jgi/Picsp_1/4885/NSC_02249-R1_---NA---
MTPFQTFSLSRWNMYLTTSVTNLCGFGVTNKAFEVAKTFPSGPSDMTAVMNNFLPSTLSNFAVHKTVESADIFDLYVTSNCTVYAGPQKLTPPDFLRLNSKPPKASSNIAAVKPPCTILGKPATSLPRATIALNFFFLGT